MGINGGHLFTYNSSPLGLLDFVNVLKDRHEQHVSVPSGLVTQVRKPTVDVDCSQVGYRFATNVSLGGSAAAVFTLATILSEHGVDVNLVCDPPHRHHSKRASVSRVADREKNRWLAVKLQNNLAYKVQQESVRGTNADLSTEIVALEKQVTTALAKSQQLIPQDFYDKLCERVSAFAPTSYTQGHILVLVDGHGAQADILMAQRAFNKITDIIWSNDADFMALLGEQACCVKNFDILVPNNNTSQPKIIDIVLSAASSTVTNRWAAVLEWDEHNKQKNVKTPRFPIFQNVPDYRVRAVAAVAIGSDVWVGGIRGCGPAAIQTCMQQLSCTTTPEDEQRSTTLAKIILCYKPDCKIGLNAFETFVDAFCYECTSTGPYHGDNPLVLDQYLEAFRTPSTIICNDLDINECVGVGFGSHLYLVAEGGHTCDTCGASICRHCTLDHRYHGIHNNLKCFPCVVGSTTEEYPCENEMRQQLSKEYFVLVPATATLSEVIGLYDIHIRDSKIDLFDGPISTIRFPVMPPTVIGSGLSVYFETLATCRVMDLSLEFQNRNLSTTDMMDIVALLAAFVSRQAWSMYASVTEDLELRHEETWSTIFPNDEKLRVVFHDSTNVPLQEPSDPDLRRALRNDYYGMCCGKGGVAIQQCGWIRTLPLFTGAIGDSEYIVQSKILEQQLWFQQKDKSSPNGTINCMDKGYRTTLMAKTNKQTNLQPAFSEGDKAQFAASATKYSAAIAALRSGNERAVHSVKMSWFLSKHTADLTNPDLEFVSNVWLAFGFQTNFMYSPVH